MAAGVSEAPVPSRRWRHAQGPLYFRLTALLLGVLLLFGVAVVVLHTVALARATVPLRLELLRLAVERAALDPFAAAHGPRTPLPTTVVDASGRVLAGDPLPAWLSWRLDEQAEGERCGVLGGPCSALRRVTLPDGRRGAVLAHYTPAGPAWGPLRLGFLLSVALWLLVSAVGGVLLLRALEHADAGRRRLLAGLAHELGTPLTSIRGFAETLLHEGQGGNERRGWTIVYREALRMQRLVEDLLALTRLEGGALVLARETLDLRELLRAAAERATLAHERAPQVELPDEPAWVSGDRDRLDQVLANLVENAYRHGRGRSLRVTLAGRDGAWQLTVRDDGPGFASRGAPARSGVRFEARHALFEPFERGDSKGGGSGLGLYLAREIVRAHGGTLGAENPPEGGALVWVRLPRAAALTGSAAPPSLG